MESIEQDKQSIIMILVCSFLKIINSILAWCHHLLEIIESRIYLFDKNL